MATEQTASGKRKYVTLHNIPTGKGVYAKPGSVVELDATDAALAKKSGSIRDYDPEKDAQKADKPGG